MRVTILKDDNSVMVNGEGHAVDLAALPSEFHALQWDGTRGEVEYRVTNCDHCGVRSKKPNEIVTSIAPYQPHLDAWAAAKIVSDTAKAKAEQEAANAAGPKD